MGSSLCSRNAPKVRVHAENRPAIKLDPACIPQLLRPLVPLAEKFGISDDRLREDFFAKIPRAEVATLKQILARHDDLLDDWLAGPDAARTDFSPEYIGFTA